MIVTAGHCVFDHTYKFGKASQIRAYIGYRGRGSINDPGVQFRSGVRVATPKEWITSDINRANDIALIQVEQAFANVRPFSYQPTPVLVDLRLGVVGYPIDKMQGDESGAEMYEMYKDTRCDLSRTQYNMLEYIVSAFSGEVLFLSSPIGSSNTRHVQGQTGSPILIRDENIAIGTHTYGHGAKNAATVIRGTYGNNFEKIIRAMDLPATIATTTNGIDYIQAHEGGEASLKEDLPPTAAAPVWAEAPSVRGIDSPFWDQLGKIVKEGAKLAGPMLGPIGAPIRVIAGTALSAAARLPDQGAEASTESRNPQMDYKEHATRAILAEAALEAVLKMGPEESAKFGVLDEMEKHYNETKDLAPSVAKIIAPAIDEPALLVAAESQAPGAEFEALLPEPPVTEGSVSSDQQAFLDSVLTANGPSSQSVGRGGFLGGLPDNLKKIVGEVTPIVNRMPHFSRPIWKLFGDEDGSESSPTDVSPQAEALSQRALLGDAALQALMKAPADGLQEQGWFERDGRHSQSNWTYRHQGRSCCYQAC